MKIVASIVLALIALVLLWNVTATSTPQAPTMATSTSIVAASASTTVPAVIPTSPVHTSAHTSVANKVATPEYRTALTCAQKVSSDVCSASQKAAAAQVMSIGKNPSDLEAWIELGVARKDAGDYVGAASAWNYVSALDPSNVVSFNNLGDLYMSYLHEYPKAVASYMQEIRNNPHGLDAYKNIFQIYTTTAYTGSATAAADILKQGIAANPKAVDLQVILARYYKAHGDRADAQATYLAAISNAQSQGKSSLVTQLQAESAGQ